MCVLVLWKLQVVIGNTKLAWFIMRANDLAENVVALKIGVKVTYVAVYSNKACCFTKLILYRPVGFATTIFYCRFHASTNCRLSIATCFLCKFSLVQYRVTYAIYIHLNDTMEKNILLTRDCIIVAWAKAVKFQWMESHSLYWSF